MIKRNISMLLVIALLVVTLSGCSAKSKVTEAQKGEARQKSNVNEDKKESTGKINEEEGLKIAKQELKNYFDQKIDDSYELKINYFGNGDESSYFQYMFWSDEKNFDIRVGENDGDVFYLEQIFLTKGAGKPLDEESAKKLSEDFIKEKMSDKADNLVLGETTFEYEKNTSNKEFYVFQYTKKDNSDKGVFIKVDCFRNYVTEITKY